MKDLIIIIIIVILYLLVFTSKGKNIVYQPLQPQTIFDIELSTINMKTEKNVASFEFSQANLPVYNVYSELYLPEKFVAKLVQSKSAADYIVVNRELLEKKFVFVEKTHAATKIQNVSKVLEVAKLSNVEKKNDTNKTVTETAQAKSAQENKQTELSYYSIKKYVAGNPKTYFYPSLSTGKEIIVSVVSYTPYQQQDILKFKIKNNSNSFFFISNVNITTENNEKLPIKFFSEQFVSPDNELEGYILFPLISKKLIFILQDNTNKAFKLNFNVP